MTSNAANPQVVDDQSKEWRHAIPALAVAIIACTVFLYGWLIAKPSVPTRYRALCEIALNEVGLGDSSESAVDESDEGLATRREKYDLINIYLKRLIEDPKQFHWARLQTARLSELYARLFSQLSALAYRSGDPKKGERFQSQATGEQTKAKDIMDELSKDQAPEAMEAKAWLISQALAGSGQTPDELALIADQVATIVDQMPNDQGMRTRLGQIRVLQALDYRNIENAPLRDKYLDEAREAFKLANEMTVLNKAFASEAYSLADEEQSLAAAMSASQVYWKLPAAQQRIPETLSAMTLCLLRLGSVEEAKGLLNSRLGSMPESARKSTLALTADGIWRLLDACAASPTPSTLKLVSPAIDILVALDSQSSRLNQILQQFVSGDAKEPWVLNMVRMLETVPDTAFMQYLKGMEAASQDDWTESRIKLRSGASMQPGLTHFFAVAVSNLAEREVRSVAFAIRFHEQLVREAPQNLFTWFERIRFCIAHEEFETAKQSLSVVEANAGQSVQVLAAIEAYYRQMKLDDDAHRVRERIQSLLPAKP